MIEASMVEMEKNRRGSQLRRTFHCQGMLIKLFVFQQQDYANRDVVLIVAVDNGDNEESEVSGGCTCQEIACTACQNRASCIHKVSNTIIIATLLGVRCDTDSYPSALTAARRLAVRKHTHFLRLKFTCLFAGTCFMKHD